MPATDHPDLKTALTKRRAAKEDLDLAAQVFLRAKQTYRDWDARVNEILDQAMRGEWTGALPGFELGPADPGAPEVKKGRKSQPRPGRTRAEAALQ